MISSEKALRVNAYILLSCYFVVFGVCCLCGFRPPVCLTVAIGIVLLGVVVEHVLTNYRKRCRQKQEQAAKAAAWEAELAGIRLQARAAIPYGWREALEADKVTLLNMMWDKNEKKYVQCDLRSLKRAPDKFYLRIVKCDLCRQFLVKTFPSSDQMEHFLSRLHADHWILQGPVVTLDMGYARRGEICYTATLYRDVPRQEPLRRLA